SPALVISFVGRMTQRGVTQLLTGLLCGVVAGHLRRLGLAGVPGLLQDRRHLGIGDEALPTLLVPLEDYPDAGLVIGIGQDGGAGRAVLLALGEARAREDADEAVEVLYRGRRQQLPFAGGVLGNRAAGRDGGRAAPCAHRYGEPGQRATRD